MDVLAGVDAPDDFDLTMKLDLSAAAGGLAFRLDDEGGGYFVEFGPKSREVVLVKWMPERDAVSGARGYRREELQRELLYEPFEGGTKTPVRLLVVGPYIEVSVRGEVVLATFSGERMTGRWGIWAECGTAFADDVQIVTMRKPD
ncbi:MAG: hypothetical protein ACR2J8_13080 [Thermomicrobiales bacterium]